LEEGRESHAILGYSCSSSVSWTTLMVLGCYLQKLEIFLTTSGQLLVSNSYIWEGMVLGFELSTVLLLDKYSTP
jgi:hypothetical protein